MRVLALLSLSAVLLCAADRVVDRVDPNRTISVRGHVHAAAAAQFDQGEADAAMPIEYATILMKPARGLEQLLADQQNPASPNFHKWLTPEQFAGRFGVSDSDMNKVTAWLRSQGLRVDDVARGRLWVTFSGTTGEINRAFKTRIHRYRVPTDTGTEMHFANVTDPSVPKAFESVVAGFDGLHDFRARAPRRDIRPLYNITTFTHRLAPDDFASIYNVKPLYDGGINGAGQKIAVIGQTNISMSDVRTFRTIFKLPDNDPQVVLFGTQPATNANDQLEAHLDVQWAGAIAPNATIIYVNSRAVTTSVQYAIDQNLAPVISFSYGGCENAGSFAISFRYLAQQANAQGITWIASAGDTGVATCDSLYATTSLRQVSKGPNVAWPASSPEVTAIGGTTFADEAGNYWAISNNENGGSALGYIPEKVWNDSGSITATGGGRSAYFPKPFWQTGPGVPNDNARMIPDVSFSASITHVPYMVFHSGAFTAVGGTSAGAPAFAGIVALLNQSLSGKTGVPQNGLGNINPALYRLAQSKPSIFHDVVDGDNRIPCAQSSPGCVDGFVGYNAGPGFDLVTGLGSIDANELINSWDFGAPSETTLTADPDTATADATVRISATVAGKSATPTGNVTFLAGNTLLGEARLDNGAASISISAQRVFAAPSNGKVTALYSGDETYTASSASTAITLTLPESGSLVIPSVTPNPVPQSGTTWSYTITLTEKNGVATKLTSFLVDGVDNNVNIARLGAGNIAAGGSVSTALVANITEPRDRTFEFAGQDEDGREWTAKLTVPFTGPVGPAFAPRISLSSSPTTGVTRNPRADPACQWSQQLTVHELGGFNVQLSLLTAGTATADNISAQIARIFGTARLAPFGTLRGRLCFSDVTPGFKTITIAGVAEAFATTSASTRVEYVDTTPADGQAEASPKTLSLTLPDAQHDSSESVALNLPADAKWSLSLAPNNRATSWLKVTPINGIGPAMLNIQAIGAGLSNGAYQATIIIDTPSLAQQNLNIPVTLVAGASDAVSIGAVTNHASQQPAYAPGMLARVTGTNLSAIANGAFTSTLPLKLGAVSATVNGVSAPIMSIATGEVVLQIPYETGIGPAILAINNDGQLAAFPIEMSAAAPGLYGITDNRFLPITSATKGQAVIVRMTGEGDTLNPVPTGFSPAFATAATRLPIPRLPVTVTIGDAPAQIDFVGIRPGNNGICELNFTIPAEAPTGVQPLVVTVGGVSAPPLTIEVK
ncbi:MAG: Ig-like domain repeat protein [Acidobacteria bacterium]|nr:Ig-like domain repeat protein [Acidobacteriota bacterium]